MKLSEKSKSIIKGIIVILIFYSSVYLQYIPVKLFNINIKTMSTTTSAILSLFSTTIIFIVFFFMYRKDIKAYFKDFIKNKNNYMDIGIRSWLIGVLVMVTANVVLNLIIKAGGANNEKAVRVLIKAVPLLMLLDAGLLSPFIEEIVFRKTLKDIFKNKWLFIIASFLLFGGAHVLNSAKVITDYLYIIPYGSLGAAFAYAYYKTNNLFTSVILHMMHNTILILILIFIAMI